MGEHNGITILSKIGHDYLGKKQKEQKEKCLGKHSRVSFCSFIKIRTVFFCIHVEVFHAYCWQGGKYIWDFNSLEDQNNFS